MTQPYLPLNDGRQIPQLGFGLWQVPAATTAMRFCSTDGCGCEKYPVRETGS